MRAITLASVLLCALVISAIGSSVAGATVFTSTYTATETIPVPPASDFAGSGGGDGWAVALSETSVYNVFHHSGELQVACHNQSNAEPCFSPELITDPEGHNFSTSGEPGLHLDLHTGKLYVYATRTSDGTAGVVCIDTTLALTNPDPYCGFTALSAVGKAPLTPAGISGASAPMLIGSHWYAFNYVNGVNQGESENELMCFDVSTDTACAGQPYSVNIGAGTVTDGGFPSPSTAAIGTKVIVPLDIGGVNRLACFDDTTQSSCGGSFPVTLATTGYASGDGAPFPMLDATGKLTGLCLPDSGVECFNLEGESATTPAELKTVASTPSSPWNGPAVILGPRVYIPNGNVGEGDVECYDYSTNASCAKFPKSFTSLGYLYTVNTDPQRPTCLWVNSDDGAHQIQDFDAYTGEACGEGTVRVLASQFVVPAPQCTPASYVSVQIVKPAPGTYTSGSVSFADGDGNPIAGLSEVALDGTGTASLAGLNLNTSTGLPQFLFTLNGSSGSIGSIEVRLTWEGNYEATCVGEHTSATVPPTPTPVVTTKAPTPTPQSGGVLAYGTAHLASRSIACVASTGYLASVTGAGITSVTFLVNGHRLKTLSKANSKGAYALRVAVKAGKVEHLTINVTFGSGDSNRSLTITKRLTRCAAPRKVTVPRFTG